MKKRINLVVLVSRMDVTINLKIKDAACRYIGLKRETDRELRMVRKWEQFGRLRDGRGGLIHRKTHAYTAKSTKTDKMF